MSKKINIDSCDTLSDHAKQTVVNHPETKGLQSAPIFAKEVIQYIKNQCNVTDSAHPLFLILTSSVSECFDITLLINRVIASDKVKTIYPHSEDKSLGTDKKIIIAPIATLQLSSVFSEHSINVSNVLCIYNESTSKLNEVILQPYLKQLSSECKIIQLQNLDTKPIEAKLPPITVIVEDEPQIEIPLEPRETPSENSDNTNINEHHIVLVDRNYKRAYLRNHLKNSGKKTIIITRTRHNAHRLEEYLYQGKVRSRILHANLSEEAKEKVIERFQSEDLSVLLLPESIAQTIELQNVEDIIYFDLPDVGLEFKTRVLETSEHFNVNNIASIVTNDEIPWIDAMEEELKWIIPRIQASAPQRSHNILRIRDRNQEKTEKRGTTRGLRKTGKNNQRRRPTNQFTPKPAPEKAPERDRDQQPTSYQSEDPFNSNQSIVNENRNPFAFDSFEANAARQNKKRVKQFFTRKETPQREVQEDFNTRRSSKKDVKVVHKKRRSFDVDGNQ